VQLKHGLCDYRTMVDSAIESNVSKIYTYKYRYINGNPCFLAFIQLIYKFAAVLIYFVFRCKIPGHLNLNSTNVYHNCFVHVSSVFPFNPIRRILTLTCSLSPAITVSYKKNPAYHFMALYRL